MPVPQDRLVVLDGARQMMTANPELLVTSALQRAAEKVGLSETAGFLKSLLTTDERYSRDASTIDHLAQRPELVA